MIKRSTEAASLLEMVASLRSTISSDTGENDSLSGEEKPPILLVLLNSIEYLAKAAVVFTGPVERRRGTFKSDKVGLEKFREGARLGERIGTVGVLKDFAVSLSISPYIEESEADPVELIVVTEVEAV